KSGFMLGLGETWDEVIEVMHDMHEHDVDILTIGQYLRPSFQHLPIQRYVPLEEFAALKAEGKKMGFRHVESGPFVRSSYHAHEHLLPSLLTQSDGKRSEEHTSELQSQSNLVCRLLLEKKKKKKK